MTTQTFSYTAAAQTFVVPTGVTSLSVTVAGAQGGTGVFQNTSFTAGGQGCTVTGTITVTPAETLQVNVGGAGVSSAGPLGGGGFNGGGNAYGDASLSYGGGGGGASDIRRGGVGLAQRVVVAGGGGGSDTGGHVGGAGGLNGGAGAGTAGGAGGTQTGGGAGGSAGGSTGTAGVSGVGGDGGVGNGNTRPGGGGGGYYGGGGGGGAITSHSSGGGGSSLLPAGGGSVTAGGVTGNGSVTLTWTPAGGGGGSGGGGAPVGACVRTAWLTLGGQTLALEDPSSGYFCTKLDVGYPAVREVKANRPDTHGIDDRTLLWGERVVSADITALAGAGARIDAVLSLFGPYMDVDARPVLHWILDRPGTAERVLILRAAGFSAPVSGDNQRDVHLQWVAADPTIRDPNTQSATAWTGSGTAPGRTYPLTYARVYPAGSTGATEAHIHTYGDFPVQPLLQIFGPVTSPVVYVHNNDGSGDFQVRFDAGYQIPAGHYVAVDCGRHTVYLDGDPRQPVMGSVDWLNTTWPSINPYLGPTVGANVGVMTMGGTSTSGATQVVAVWQDAYNS